MDLLHIKSWQKINLKYSAYLMDRVDVENSIINLESQGMLELTDNQVHYVFGIPIGEHTILSEGVEPSDACVEFTRVAAGISDKGTHSLKASEEYLNRDITVDSRKIDKDCFKFAFVIFVVGHALAPSAKHDYIKIDFWSALNDVTKIKEWNWCRYLLSHLFQAVRKFKSDVLVLDSLDLNVNSKPQGVYPRFALFDYDSMKKMVDAISVNMGGGEISYHRSSVRREQNVSKELVCVDDPANNFSRPTPTPKRAQFTSAPAKRASYIKTGPLEFANHIRTKYPTISGEKLGMILNEHNARGLAHISEMRQSFQSTMFNFVDKLVSCIADNCTCCKAFGRKECRLKNEDDIDAENAPAPNNEGTVFLTPISNKINTRLEGIFANEGSYSGNSSNARKRNCVMGSSNATDSQKKICVSPNEPIQVLTPSGIDILNNSSISAKDGARNQVVDIVYSFFDDLTACIASYYAELRPSSNYVTFGTTNDVVPSKIRLPKCKLACDPWSVGSVPLPPSQTVLRTIKDWFLATSRLTLERHEVGAIIFTRFSQMDKFYNQDTATMIWRKFLEPDFATAVLSNADPLTIQSIRTSFTDGVADLNPASSRLIEVELQTCFIVFCHRYNYGAGTTFLAWNFDGEKFQIPVTKDNLERHKNWLLYEVMRTDGNESMIPSDAIEAIKGSFLAL
ncbi:hypothetical protein D1007_07977 [Hordeum vulgare]|nr:hypothetical protein D1007_07977 [Hordeum vulgare]